MKSRANSRPNPRCQWRLPATGTVRIRTIRAGIDVDGAAGMRHDPGVRPTNVVFLVGLALASAACETTTPGLPAGTPAARGPLRVELLDDRFVRVEGERMPRQEFAFRARIAGRRYAKENKSQPKILLSWADGAVTQAVVDDMITQLRLAGVRHIELTDE